MLKYDVIREECRWALVDTRSLKVHSPWIKGSKDAVKFAHRHCRGWDLEAGLEVTDWESYRRLRFQRYELPRMAEQQQKQTANPRGFRDLVQFHPFRAEVKRGTGEKQIW